ncbi:MAG TPA: mechanosensitive ion channel domain-containing protein [Dongiaceae bacterium]|jgi:small conductance mechanosensitive channel
MTIPKIDFSHIGDLFVVYGINVLGAIFIALVGWWLARVAERLAHRALLASSHMDRTIAVFLSSLIRYAVLTVTLILILQVIGIQATSLVAVLGATSLAIGLALQGTLSNVAAGVMLLIFRPFKLGDSIEVGGKSGTVQNLNLFMTELASGDNVQVLIPNGQVWGQAMTNTSAYATRRVALTFPILAGKNVEVFSSNMRKFIERDKRVLKDPAPSVTVANITETSIQVSVQAWTTADDAGGLRTDLLQRALSAGQAPANPDANSAAA